MEVLQRVNVWSRFLSHPAMAVQMMEKGTNVAIAPDDIEGLKAFALDEK